MKLPTVLANINALKAEGGKRRREAAIDCMYNLGKTLEAHGQQSLVTPEAEASIARAIDTLTAIVTAPADNTKSGSGTGLEDMRSFYLARAAWSLSKLRVVKGVDLTYLRDCITDAVKHSPHMVGKQAGWIDWAQVLYGLACAGLDTNRFAPVLRRGVGALMRVAPAPDHSASVGNVLYAVALARAPAHLLQPLLEALGNDIRQARHAKAKEHWSYGADTQLWANSLWALAKLELYDGELVRCAAHHLAVVEPSQMYRGRPLQWVSTMLWALAKLGWYDEALFTRALSVLQVTMARAKPQDVCNILVACAQTGHTAGLLPLLSAVRGSDLGAWKSQDIGNALYTWASHASTHFSRHAMAAAVARARCAPAGSGASPAAPDSSSTSTDNTQPAAATNPATPGQAAPAEAAGTDGPIDPAARQAAMEEEKALWQEYDGLAADLFSQMQQLKGKQPQHEEFCSQVWVAHQEALYRRLPRGGLTGSWVSEAERVNMRATRILSDSGGSKADQAAIQDMCRRVDAKCSVSFGGVTDNSAARWQSVIAHPACKAGGIAVATVSDSSIMHRPAGTLTCGTRRTLAQLLRAYDAVVLVLVRDMPQYDQAVDVTILEQGMRRALAFVQQRKPSQRVSTLIVASDLFVRPPRKEAAAVVSFPPREPATADSDNTADTRSSDDGSSSDAAEVVVDPAPAPAAVARPPTARAPPKPPVDVAAAFAAIAAKAAAGTKPAAPVAAPPSSGLVRPRPARKEDGGQ